MDAATAAVDDDRVPELEALRRRAYGPGAGIADDPVAQARLAELEAAAHAAASIPVVAARKDVATETPAVGHPQATVLTPEPAPGAIPRIAWWRDRRVWAIAVGVLLIAGVAIVVTLASIVRPDAVLAPSSEGNAPELTAFDERTLAYYDLAAEDLVPREAYRGIDVWSADGANGRRCLFVGRAGQLWNGTCMPQGLDPVIDVTVFPYMQSTMGSDLPNGTVVRFTLTEETVEVRVALPATGA